jgi:hypothetical protein
MPDGDHLEQSARRDLVQVRWQLTGPRSGRARRQSLADRVVHLLDLAAVAHPSILAHRATVAGY